MIRKALLTDFEAIKKIQEDATIKPANLNKSTYREAVQKSGFLLLSDLSKDNFTVEINRLFLVDERQDKITGFIRFDTYDPYSENRKATVLLPELIEEAHTNPYIYLGRIAVAPEFRQQGVASTLYKQAEEQLRQQGIKYVISFVVASPVTNTSSIFFHESQGFERTDLSYPFALSGFTNYQSFMYIKKIN